MRHIDKLEDLAILLKADLSRYDVNPGIEHAGIRLDMAATQIAGAIRIGDRPAAVIGYQLLMEDPHLPFGKLFKSNLARAFRQRIDMLTEQEKVGLARKTAELLSLQYCPRELEDYCRLVKRMGEQLASMVVAHSRPVNERAHSLVAYLASPRSKQATAADNIKQHMGAENDAGGIGSG